LQAKKSLAFRFELRVPAPGIIQTKAAAGVE
jgi:hypothetical protein